MLGNLGTAELLIIGIVVMMLFGGKKLNELAKGLGQSTKEYKKLKTEYSKAVNLDFTDDEPSEPSKPKTKTKKHKKSKGGESQ